MKTSKSSVPTVHQLLQKAIADAPHLFTDVDIDNLAGLSAQFRLNDLYVRSTEKDRKARNHVVLLTVLFIQALSRLQYMTTRASRLWNSSTAAKDMVDKAMEKLTQVSILSPTTMADETDPGHDQIWLAARLTETERGVLLSDEEAHTKTLELTLRKGRKLGRRCHDTQ